ncbi:MAG: UDP-N-acetylmuramoyl-L-alanyl-D-glutamate--2,6-diaminopimelate ligase [Thermaerobacterales bacterium]
MKYEQLVEALTPVLLTTEGSLEGEVTGIAYDSRLVRPGFAFIPWRGGKVHGDGHRFIPDALAAGASVIVAERGAAFSAPDISGTAVLLEVSDSRRALGLAAAAFYRHPSREMRIVGVTGTNGKTTTTQLIRHLLLSQARRVGLIGTVHNLVGDQELPVTLTTPQSPEIQELLGRMRDDGCNYGVLEVASHALDQKRTEGCEFDVAVFTNLSQDHLDYHGSMSEYAAAKRRLFENLGTAYHGEPKGGPKYAVINGDDAAAGAIAASCSVPVHTYGLSDQVQIRAVDVRVHDAGTEFDLVADGRRTPVSIPLMGRFNVYNTLAAVTVALQEGIALPDVVNALDKVVPVRGRFERVEAGQAFTVIVDYAHTPDGLENILSTAREFTRGRLIVVFGAGGDRDRGKRPLMGETAARLADYLIITSDNPRSEEPGVILADIEAGITASEHVERPRELLVERAPAIEGAVMMAGPDDVVVIAGKGHETYQIFRDRTIHFDDREVAAEAICRHQAAGREL